MTSINKFNAIAYFLRTGNFIDNNDLVIDVKKITCLSDYLIYLINIKQIKFCDRYLFVETMKCRFKDIAVGIYFIICCIEKYKLLELFLITNKWVLQSKISLPNDIRLIKNVKLGEYTFDFEDIIKEYLSIDTISNCKIIPYDTIVFSNKPIEFINLEYIFKDNYF